MFCIDLILPVVMRGSSARGMGTPKRRKGLRRSGRGVDSEISELRKGEGIRVDRLYNYKAVLVEWFFQPIGFKARIELGFNHTLTDEYLILEGFGEERNKLPGKARIQEMVPPGTRLLIQTKKAEGIPDFWLCKAWREDDPAAFLQSNRARSLADEIIEAGFREGS